MRIARAKGKSRKGRSSNLTRVAYNFMLNQIIAVFAITQIQLAFKGHKD